MIKYKPTVAALLGLFLIPTANANQDGQMDKTSFQKATASNSDISLGSGFLNNAMIPMHNRCIKNMDVSFKDVRSSISLERSDNLTKIGDILNVNLKAKAGWGKFSVKAAANYMNDIKENDYSINFTFINTIFGHASLDTSEYYGEDALSAGGVAALRKSPDAFIARCGDQYIRSVDMGAVLMATIKIKFTDQNQKKQFSANIKGKIGDVLKASGKINSELANNYAGAEIEVVALQLGGQPNYLSQIFGSNEEHAAIHCDMEHLDNCTKAMDNILDYAQANGAWKETGFAKQINIIDGKVQAESLSALNLSDAGIGSYNEDFGIDINLKPLTTEAGYARLKLNNLYDQHEEKANFAQSVLHSKNFSRLSSVTQEKLKKIARTLESNLNLFSTEHAMDCFLPSTQDLCPLIVEKIKQQIIEIDTSELDLLKDAYYFNINYKWPFVMVKTLDKGYVFYNLNLQPANTTTHNINIIPGIDFSYLVPSGGYSYYDGGKQTRYYFDYYGTEDFVYKNYLNFEYTSNVPWNTCINGVCSKYYVNVQLLPF